MKRKLKSTGTACALSLCALLLAMGCSTINAWLDTLEGETAALTGGTSGGQRASNLKIPDGWKISDSQSDEKPDQPLTDDDFKVTQNPDNTVTIIEYLGKDKTKNIVIPDTLFGLKVTKIGKGAFSGQSFWSDVVSIVIPDTVTEIGDEAFINLVALSKVTLGKGLVKIGAKAFAGWVSLESIVIPDSVTEIGDEAFRNSESDFKYIEGVRVETIDRKPKKVGLTSVTLPKGLKKIGLGVFAGNNLTEFPASWPFDAIPTNVFSANQITTLVIPNNIKRIGGYLTGEGGYIGGNAFANNPITTLTIPASLAAHEHTPATSDVVSAVSSGLTRAKFTRGILGSFGDKLTRITVPANMDDRNLKAFSELPNFVTLYKSQGKAAGTYVTKGGGIWMKE
jgi:hypothetical protein